ncbi:hypothetical protein DJ568_05205 [Mucilaginibacter hurinus]|uniref:Outer membrane protein beta-barrel domain-containing protein n=1 Tax=Mucilaginibacter hurinus TaxID=2201324 RepID=A0A367GRQ9_9SPHI|nr:hypothetical protein [Mucilaginibacter hurinus]RCH56144.1 hypothetical protein DJ568_05205 [Mucilaginibacter hurinus]
MERKLRLNVLFICFAAVLFSTEAMAGGWPVKKGKYLVSLSTSFFRSTKLWDSVGGTKNYPSNGYFQSIGFSTYMEYGISRRVTGVASLPLMVNKFMQDSTGIPRAVTALGDAEVGIRYYLANIDYKYYFGIQGTAILPLYSSVAVGLRTPGAELKFAGSTAGKIGSKTFYLNAEVGGRQYFAIEGPFQLKYGASFGFNFDKKNMVTVGGAGTYSVSSDKSVNPNIVVNRDFSYTMASLSYGHTFSPQFSMFAGVNHFLVGRSTGQGTSFSLSFATRF